jgi:RNA methyltransferase, TrmH family
MKLTSSQNPKVKAVVALRRGRERREAGVMLVEGFEELSLAIESGVRPLELYYCPELMAGSGQMALLARSGVPPSAQFEVSRPVFEKIAYREGADGWLAVAPAVATNLHELRVPPGSFFLVCEAVEKPGNLGAMLRTAEAAGVHGVIAVETVTDWGNPNIVRASKGALFSVPVAEASRAEALEWLKQHGIKLVAATPAAEEGYTQVDLTGPVAVAVGAEKPGLTGALMEAANQLVRIPMAGRVDSLNVATSAALLMYEVVRQRQV